MVQMIWQTYNRCNKNHLIQPENLNGSNDMTDLQQIQQRSFNTTRKVEWIKWFDKPTTDTIKSVQVKGLRHKISFIVFEPKHSVTSGCLYRTDAIPLSQMESLYIERLMCYLKDNLVCLDLAYFQPQNKPEK